MGTMYSTFHYNLLTGCSFPSHHASLLILSLFLSHSLSYTHTLSLSLPFSLAPPLSLRLCSFLQLTLLKDFKNTPCEFLPAGCTYVFVLLINLLPPFFTHYFRLYHFTSLSSWLLFSRSLLFSSSLSSLALSFELSHSPSLSISIYLCASALPFVSFELESKFHIE
jgi:hypothetical protein